jgi:hypothetical protein
MFSKFEKELLSKSHHINLLDGDYCEPIQEKGKLGKRVSLSEFGRKAELINKNRKHNPIVPGLADFIQGILWDRFVQGASTNLPASFSWFTVPYGQGGKTNADTNLQLTSTLPAPQWMNVVSLGLYLSSLMRKQDIDTYFNTYYIRFYVDQKYYLEGPPWMFPAPGGMTGFYTLAAAADQSFFTNGVPQSFNFFDLRLPQGIDLGGVTTDGATGILINQGQTFHVDSNGTSFTLAAADGAYGGFNVVCVLTGILSRSVQ